MRRLLFSFSFLAVAFGVAAACTTDYQLGLEDPRFGAPNALAGQRTPGPSSDNDLGDGGGTAQTKQPLCTNGGAAIIDGGACAVSFRSVILPAMAAAACQTAGCHGGATPLYLPRIDPADPNGQWAEFAGFKLSNGKPYINPCSQDPEQSTIACNVNKAAPCGSLMPAAVGLPPDVVTQIDTWVKCGAPNN